MIQRKSELKRSQKKRSQGQDEFWAAVTENGTAICWLDSEHGRGFECDYLGQAPDAHHWIEKRTIRSTYATRIYHEFDLDALCALEDERDRALADPRDGSPLCRRHHDWLTGHVLRVSRVDLPESVFAFTKDYGLEAQLDRLYPSKEAA